MSVMRLFGKAKEQPQTNPHSSLQKLRDAQAMLEKREEYLEKKVQSEVLFAKENAVRNKKAALLALKRKRMYESQLSSLLGARSTLDTQILAIEGHSATFASFSAMREGAAAMKTMNQNMQVEDVDEMMDEIRETMEDAREVGEAMGRGVGGEDYDDEELERELEALTEPGEGLAEGEPTCTPPPSYHPLTPLVPVVPVASRGLASKAEDDEFAALEREMGLS